MSDTLTHVAVADMLAKVLFTVKKPLLVFLIAFISHGLLDVTDNEYTPVPNIPSLIADADYLFVQTGGLIFIINDIFKDTNEAQKANRITALIGTAAPDIIDGLYSLFYPEKWSKGELIFPFHRFTLASARQSKPASMSKTVMITIVSITIKFN